MQCAFGKIMIKLLNFSLFIYFPVHKKSATSAVLVHFAHYGFRVSFQKLHLLQFLQTCRWHTASWPSVTTIFSHIPYCPDTILPPYHTAPIPYCSFYQYQPCNKTISLQKPYNSTPTTIYPPTQQEHTSISAKK